MKVLMLNGSPRKNGNTCLALGEMEKVFAQEGIETEIIQVGAMDIPGCVACCACWKTQKCFRNDIVNTIKDKLGEADGLVLASPVYYGSANGTLTNLLDRLFYALPYDTSMKVGASVVIARRGGCSSTFDQLNKYFTISGMPVVSSCYWNSVHGMEKGEAEQDLEGLRVMRTLAKNMAFMIKSIALGKEKYGLPEKEPFVMTNFVR